MATKTTLNAANLERLGAPALAELLMEISTGSAVAKRRLRLALAGSLGAAEAAAAIHKRLATIARSRTRITADRRKALALDLQTQFNAILSDVAPTDRKGALDLLWRFCGLASGITARDPDRNGTLADVFAAAIPPLARLAEESALPPASLADRMLDLLTTDMDGVFATLIPAFAPALGQAGLEALKAQIRVLDQGPRARLAAHLMRQIAEAQGDVAAYLAGWTPEQRENPAIAGRIAHRLIDWDDPAAALALLDAADTRRAQLTLGDWQDARLRALEALGDKAGAQAFRWACFVRNLSAAHLRAHLQRLPDFDDIEAEDRAMAYAAKFPNILKSLVFLIQWPNLEAAAKLVLARHSELDGDAYDTLSMAATALAPSHPLAATLLLRAMIDFALLRARQARYPHIARHFAQCADLAPMISDHAGIEPHDLYARNLRETYARRAGFWAHCDAGKSG